MYPTLYIIYSRLMYPVYHTAISQPDISSAWSLMLSVLMVQARISYMYLSAYGDQADLFLNTILVNELYTGNPMNHTHGLVQFCPHCIHPYFQGHLTLAPADPAPAKFVGKMGLPIHTHCIAVAGNTNNKAPIQYKDAILPVNEVPLWR